MPSDALRNSLKSLWDNGQPAVGTMVLVCSDLAVAQIAAAAGMDYVYYDLEYRPQHSQKIHDLCQMTRLSGMAALVGPKDIEPHSISHALDLGANAIVLPHVETVEEVKMGIEATLYPPLGRRGAAGVAGHNMYVPHPIAEQVTRMNEQTQLLLKVESDSAIDRLEELVEPEGVAGVTTGPLDLSLSMGLAGKADSAQVRRLTERVQKVCEQRGIAFGAQASTPDDVRRALDSGAQWVTASYDGAALQAHWQELAAVKPAR